MTCGVLGTELPVDYAKSMLERCTLSFAKCVTGLALLSSQQLGCSDGGRVCSDQAIAGVTVTVVDSNGARVCDATVVAHDGTFSENLMQLGYGSGCTYGGAWERAGTYTIDVVSGSKTKSVENVVVTSGECHVNGQGLTVTLDP